MTKISVVIPVYNVEKYLAQCLESITNQTLREIEIICVNDGSTDGSFEILREFSKKDARIMVIDKENSGYGATVNLGISAARGEYISIIESDDFIEQDMLEDLYEIALKNDCDVVKSDWFNYWTKNDMSVKNGKIPPDKSGKVMSAKSYPESLLIQPSVWSAIYKKSFLTKNNIKFLETPGASYQDTSFTFKVFSLAERIILKEKAYLYYRQDNEGSSINSKNKAYAIFDEYDEINKFLEENPQTKIFNAQKQINEYKAAIWTLRRISPELRQDFASELSKRFKTYYEAGELSDGFMKKYGKKNTDVLISNSEEFLKNFEKGLKKEKINEFRRNLLSVKINKARISIKLFGRQVLSKTF